MAYRLEYIFSIFKCMTRVNQVGQLNHSQWFTIFLRKLSSLDEGNITEIKKFASEGCATYFDLYFFAKSATHFTLPLIQSQNCRLGTQGENAA